MKKVAIIMGSASDLPIVEKTVERLKTFNIPYTCHVLSAHRSPQKTEEFSKNAGKNGYGVIIAVAGMAAHLAGIIAANTTLPVIGIPATGSPLNGIDALLSTLQMPGGIPVATMAINGGENAAIFAAQILSLSDKETEKKLSLFKKEIEEKVLASNKMIGEKFNG